MTLEIAILPSASMYTSLGISVFILVMIEREIQEALYFTTGTIDNLNLKNLKNGVGRAFHRDVWLSV